MRILGVDPGTHKAGVGIIDLFGNKLEYVHSEVIKTPSKEIISKRLIKIYERLKELIVEYKPEVLSLENLFYAKDIQAVVRIGEARACAMLAAEKNGLEIVEYMPTKVKKAITGNGRASKEQMQFMIKKLMKLNEEPPSDAADALAIAVCHTHYMKFKKITVKS